MACKPPGILLQYSLWFIMSCVGPEFCISNKLQRVADAPDLWIALSSKDPYHQDLQFNFLRLNSGSEETGVLLFVRGLAMTRWNRELVVIQPLSPVNEIMTCGENRSLHWDVKTGCVLALLESLISLAPEAQLNPRKPGSTLLQIASANNFLSLLNQLELELHDLQPRFLTIKNWNVMAK